MTKPWQHLDADGLPVEEGKTYTLVRDDLGVHVEGIVQWTKKYGFVIQFTTRRGIFVTENQTMLDWDYAGPKKLVYKGLKRKRVEQ